MKVSAGLNIFSRIVQMTTALFLILFYIGCNQSQRSLAPKIEKPDKDQPKPQPIPPNYDPKQFSLNSWFTFRETLQVQGDGKSWIELHKHCYSWFTTDIKPNLVTFEVSKQIDCGDEDLEKWKRTIMFVTLTGEVISDQIVNGTEGIQGELSNQSIAPIFFTNRNLGMDHQLLKEFKTDQAVYSAFKVKNTVYWNNPESPFHSLRLYHVAPGAKDSKMRTIISLETVYP